jgi:hypothetical protein
MDPIDVSEHIYVGINSVPSMKDRLAHIERGMSSGSMAKILLGVEEEVQVRVQQQQLHQQVLEQMRGNIRAGGDQVRISGIIWGLEMKAAPRTRAQSSWNIS